MNRKIAILALAVFGMSTIMGCTKKTADGSVPSISASIGGVSYKAPYCLAVRNGSQLVIEGLSGTNVTPTYPYAALYVSRWTGVSGTYKIDSTGANYGLFLTSSSSNSFSQSGSITLNSVTADEITGSFSFKCTDGTDITGGTFTARVQPQP